MKKESLVSLLKVAAGLVATALISQWAGPRILHQIELSSMPHVLPAMLVLTVVLFMSYVSSYLAHLRPVPSFVIVLLLGIAAKPLLLPIVEDREALEIVATTAAAVILFQGGLETPLRNFRRLFPKIFMLAFPGVLISALALSYAGDFLANWTGIAIGITTVSLLGAILASTDPAAVIPLFKTLRFRDAATKDITVSESAVNDVVGALLSVTLLGVAHDQKGFISIAQGYGTLLNAASGIFLLKQLVVGTIIGIAGWGLLRLFQWLKGRKDITIGPSGSYLLSVPIACFLLAPLWGGSGFLAAFVAGLLFNVSSEMEHHVEHYGENYIDGLAKPTIFLLLGAMVNLPDLVHYAGIGLAIAAVFIFIIRPLMVVLMGGAVPRTGGERLTWNQIKFIAWIRETGAIPAVLLVTAASLKIPGTEAVVPIGLWVILATLIIQPPTTAKIAQKLGIAEPAVDTGMSSAHS